MNLSNEIANLILHMLDEADSTEIQRNELAQTLGCVPSQINYVLASRFTPEQGYVVESRRGGGGYIKITRVNFDRGAMLLHVINSIGTSIDAGTCRAHIQNLFHRGVIPQYAQSFMLAATSDKALFTLEPEQRDATRASILKQLLLTAIDLA